MTERIRATVVVEFEADDMTSAVRDISKTFSTLKRELPDVYEPELRPDVELQSIEKAVTSREVVERTVEVTEETNDT